MSIKRILRRAEEHYFQKRYNIALKLFLFIIQRDPENTLAYRYSGDIFLLQGKLTKAKEQFIIARELSTQPEEEWFRIAQVYILEKQGSKALHALQKALAIKPDMHLCHFYLGLLHFKFFENKQKAIEHWEIYHEHAPEEEKTKMQRALKILKPEEPIDAKSMGKSVEKQTHRELFERIDILKKQKTEKSDANTKNQPSAF